MSESAVSADELGLADESLTASSEAGSGDPDAPLGAAESVPSDDSPRAGDTLADTPEDVATHEVPAFVITCPTCQTSIPFVPGIEGYEPSMSKHSHPCEDCDGFGQVKTGSLVAIHAVITCPGCEGKGWKPNNEAAATAMLPHGEPPWVGATWSDEIGGWR